MFVQIFFQAPHLPWMIGSEPQLCAPSLFILLIVLQALGPEISIARRKSSKASSSVRIRFDILLCPPLQYNAVANPRGIIIAFSSNCASSLAMLKQPGGWTELLLSLLSHLWLRSSCVMHTEDDSIATNGCC